MCLICETTKDFPHSKARNFLLGIIKTISLCFIKVKQAQRVGVE
jgi:hypothetical protein